MANEWDGIPVWVPGRPRSLQEVHIEKPMQDIALMAYQDRLRREFWVSFANTGLLPLMTQVTIDVKISSRLPLDIIKVIKPILDAAKGTVFKDDSSVRSLTVRLEPSDLERKRGPDGTIIIEFGMEETVQAQQPHKIHRFLPVTVIVNAEPRQDEAPHSKDGKPKNANSPEMDETIALIKGNAQGAFKQPIFGEVMVSMKVRSRERVLDLDNVGGLYLRALEGVAYHSITQIKHLYITFMDVEVFQYEEGVYITIARYDPEMW